MWNGFSGHHRRSIGRVAARRLVLCLRDAHQHLRSVRRALEPSGAAGRTDRVDVAVERATAAAASTGSGRHDSRIAGSDASACYSGDGDTRVYRLITVG